MKAALALRGHTPSSWARRHNFNVKTVHAVINGKRSGRRSPELVRALEALSHV